MAKVSLTQKSLDWIRKEEGTLLVAVTERWCSFTRRKHDLFGFADLIWVSDSGVTLVQTTSISNMSARIKKIFESDNSVPWMLAPSTRIVVQGWRKMANGRYEHRERYITLDDLKQFHEKTIVYNPN